MKNKYLLNCFLLFSLGSLTSLSLPPYNYFFINFFTLSFFFLILFKDLKNSSNKKKFFFYGWIFGYGYFFFSLYWISISLTFDENFNILIPFSVILIPAFLSLFYGGATIIFFYFKLKNIISAFFLFALLFGITEFFRGHILTGFPWNFFVFSLAERLNFISIISIIGTYSLNLLVISIFTAPAILFFKNSKKLFLVPIFFLLLPIIFISYGLLYKKAFLNYELKNNNVTIRVIGSNITLDRFYNNDQTELIINELIKISEPDQSKEMFFLWPEGIIPNIFQDELILYKDIFKKNFNINHLIGLGINSREIINNKNEYYNSFAIFNDKAELIKKYNKVNLVPFGEFLPFEKLMNKIGLKAITNNYYSYSKGNKRVKIEIKANNFDLTFLPLICYEIIYSGKISNNNNFDFIFNISEDGWFGKSIGPNQHFTHSIFRSIESGKYVIRSSNNGIAAIVNPLGVVEKRVKFGQTGYIDFEKSRNIEETIFSKYGNKIFWVITLLYIFLVFLFNHQKFIKKLNKLRFFDNSFY